MNEDDVITVDDMIDQIFPGQSCGATRPRLKDPNWECDGTDLVVVLPATGTMPPTVVKKSLLWHVDDAIAHWLAVNGWTEFEGGDHLHLRVRKPEGRRTDVG